MGSARTRALTSLLPPRWMCRPRLRDDAAAICERGTRGLDVVPAPALRADTDRHRRLALLRMGNGVLGLFAGRPAAYAPDHARVGVAKFPDWYVAPVQLR